MRQHLFHLSSGNVNAYHSSKQGGLRNSSRLPLLLAGTKWSGFFFNKLLINLLNLSYQQFNFIF